MMNACERSRRIVATACIAALALRSAFVLCVHEDGAPRAESLLLASCCAAVEACPSSCEETASVESSCPSGHDDGDRPCRGCSDYSFWTVSPQCAVDGGSPLDDSRLLAAPFGLPEGAVAVLEFRVASPSRHAAGPPSPPILPRLRSVFLLL
jgi:hypothetical protein